MATYAIGDIQGCFEPLQTLLKKIDFNTDRDTLWLVGDLVNRGPASLETLRFCYTHRDNLVCVLGNHDLHLLAVAHQNSPAKRKDTLDEILQAPDRGVLLSWLQSCPLLHHDEQLSAVLVHAGIAPCWSLPQAAAHAREVEAVLQSSDVASFFAQMYGNQPAGWDEHQQGPTRWRTITNYFTRMRLVKPDGSLDFSYKGPLDAVPDGLFPWFDAPERKLIEPRIIFGHWAALKGLQGRDDVIGLDTGCVWGNALSAYCLEDGRWISHLS